MNFSVIWWQITFFVFRSVIGQLFDQSKNSYVQLKCGSSPLSNFKYHSFLESIFSQVHHIPDKKSHQTMAISANPISHIILAWQKISKSLK